MKNKLINQTWTLFLDRDGVINEEIVGSYVTDVKDFVFCKGALQAINILSNFFNKTIIVTNQRGVGKGIMSLQDLGAIHNQLQKEVEANKGIIHQIYAATSVDDHHHNRKPQPGMALQAQQDFPEIDFTKSIMVGNSPSDIEFGKKLGMHTVFLTTTHQQVPSHIEHMVDEVFSSLVEWAKHLEASVIENFCVESTS